MIGRRICLVASIVAMLVYAADLWGKDVLAFVALALATVVFLAADIREELLK